MFRFRSILLLLVLALPMLVKTGLVANYWINYQHYSKVLCENKNKPMLHCNGKCALGKELDKARQAEKDSQEGAQLLREMSIDAFVVQPFVPSVVLHAFQSARTFPGIPQNELTADGFLSSNFHPPGIFLA